MGRSRVDHNIYTIIKTFFSHFRALNICIPNFFLKVVERGHKVSVAAHGNSILNYLSDLE